MLFESVVLEDRSVLDAARRRLHLRQRAAGAALRHAEHLRRCSSGASPVTDDARRGLLGHGSILALTSYTNRTSPVTRGKYVLTNILGTPPPAPPANVPPLDEKPGKPLTMRERMEAHRASPACAGCHKLMDPIGLALENFDGIGRWRSTDDGVRDRRRRAAVRTAPTVNGPAALRQAMLQPARQFARNMTEMLLTYALGRGVEPTRHAVRPRDREGRRAHQLPFLVARARHRQERAVSDGGGRSHDDHQEGHLPPHRAARHRRRRGPAAAGRHGAGADGPGRHAGRAAAALRVHLRAARLDHEGVDAGAGGRGLRVLADPQAARASSART